MHHLLSRLKKEVSARRVGATLLAIGLGLAGCKDTTEAVPEAGVNYYPVSVGNYWVYAVTDTVWSSASQGVASVPSPTSYKVKETITGTYADAAGQPVYKMVRSKLVAPATDYRDDSVFTVRTSDQAVVVNRSNTPTVELIFPVKDGRSWNFNAYNNNTNDTITAETRQYSRVGQPFTTAATAGIAAKNYPTTLVTANTGTAVENSLLKQRNYQQVFAKGIGPVYRRRDYFENFYYTNLGNGNVVYVKGSYFKAVTRRESLIEYSVK
ncbi:hypothetical protein [Hymenobacter rubidus]|uniref:hypothetical protein n=1 Tax=Hymenobacter rubidus TaxID=1441626 RepID=UPI00191F5E01|nr:hypothetical protein [Hymenobacter rubidus]